MIVYTRTGRRHPGVASRGRGTEISALPTDATGKSLLIFYICTILGPILLVFSHHTPLSKFVLQEKHCTGYPRSMDGSVYLPAA